VQPGQIAQVPCADAHDGEEETPALQSNGAARGAGENKMGGPR
jgi:hypothetical protein